MLEMLTDYRIDGVPRYYFGDSDEALMQIPDEIRKSVVFIGYKETNAPEKIVFGGTAFFVEELDVKRASFTHLVTAKHNIMKIMEKGIDDKVYLRCNFKNKPADNIPIDIDKWVFHPSDLYADVAVFPLIPLSKEVDYRAYPLTSAATTNWMEEEKVGIGDEVFLVGLFVFHKGTKKNIPIIRVGNIAAMPEELVKKTAAYLIESRSLGGLSGSPVFVHLGFTRYREGKVMMAREYVFRLLGLMHGHWDTDDLDIDVFVEDDQGKINSGIAIVTPIDKIIETIKQPRLTELKKEIIEKHEAKILPTSDIG